MRKRNFKSQDILCAEAELRDLKVKALVWKRNCETSSRTKFIVWKRNCVTSKSQYVPCAEAELRHFRAPKSHTILYAEPELRNFKYIPCAEAELQAKEYSMCGSGTSSHIIICIWNLSGFLCNNPKCPGAQGRRPLCQSHLGCAVLNYAILAVAPTGIVLVCSVLIKHNRIS